MSFWKKLFGGGDEIEAGGGKSGGGPLDQEEYKDFLIKAVEMRAGSEFQLAGTIEKDVGGDRKRHDFVRADRFSSRDEAASFALAKGRQIVDEQGEGLFQQSWPQKPN